MKPVRHGETWTAAERDWLLREVAGTDGVAEIAVRHQRSETAILLQVDHLVAASSTLEDLVAVFAWARAELRKGRAGLLAWAMDRIEAAIAWEPPPAMPPLAAAQVAGPRDVAPAATGKVGAWARREQADRDKVAAVWSLITMRPLAQAPGGPEVAVLARHDEALLESVGARLFRRHGRLALADWVLDCDWLDVELLRLTSEQVSADSDDVGWIGAELLRAGLVKVRSPVDRDIVFRRVGLEGDAVTLTAIGRVHGVSGERVRQRYHRGLAQASVGPRPGEVFRAWDHVHGVLAYALGTRTGQLDPDLVRSFIERVIPAAPPREAVQLIARLCGYADHDWPELDRQVAEVGHRRERERAKQRRVERSLGTLNAKFQAVLDKADWPPPSDAGPLRLPFSGPLREPHEPDERSNSGYWYSERLCRHVGYDSDTELTMIRLVDGTTLVTTYCEQPLAIPYRMNGRDHTYYPDLAVDLHDGRRLVIEVKGGPTDLVTYRNILKFQAATAFCHAMGWGFLAIDHRGRTPDHLVGIPVDPTHEQLIRRHVETGPIEWKTMRAIMLRHDITNLSLAAIIGRNHWYLSTTPWLVSTAPLDR